MAKIMLTDNDFQALLLLAEGEQIDPLAARTLLLSAGVVYGLRQDELAKLGQVCGPAEVVLAEGHPPVHGEDAVIELLFQVGSQSLAPVIREDGSADFRNLGVVEHARPGQILARRTPPRDGHEGRTVKGRVLVPRRGRDKGLAAGKGATISADGLTVVAAQEGHPFLSGRVVGVNSAFTVEGTVGLGTGNIVYDGDLVIQGGVEAHSEVRATGTVTIKGHVDGARIVAGRALIIQGGVRHQSVLEAGEDMVAKFIENTHLRCGGMLMVQEDLVQCQAEVGGSAMVGRAIVGGELLAGGRIEARSIGARLGTATMVGSVPHQPTSPELQELEAEREAVRSERGQLARPAGTDLERKRQVIEKTEELNEQERELTERILELRAKLPHPRGLVAVRDRVHPGVHVVVGESHLTTQDSWPAGQLVEEEGHLRLLPFIPGAPDAKQRTVQGEA